MMENRLFTHLIHMLLGTGLGATTLLQTYGNNLPSE